MIHKDITSIKTDINNWIMRLKIKIKNVLPSLKSRTKPRAKQGIVIG